MTAASMAAIAELRAASAQLHTNPTPVLLIVADLLDGYATYWSMWFPTKSAASARDVSVINLARAILRDSAAPQAPEADPGTGRNITLNTKEG